MKRTNNLGGHGNGSWYGILFRGIEKSDLDGRLSMWNYGNGVFRISRDVCILLLPKTIAHIERRGLTILFFFSHVKHATI